MAFKRAPDLDPPPSESVLHARMAGIGMHIGHTPDHDAQIEQALVHTAQFALDAWDMRVLGVLVVWLEVHHAHIHVARLKRCVCALVAPRQRAFWSAAAVWLARVDRRFDALARVYEGERLDVLDAAIDSQIARRGEDARFEGTWLRVPEGMLRRRLEDVFEPADLARLHPGYRNRLLMGPCWRADIWTVLQRQPDLCAAGLAREARCTFASAWHVRQDFELLRASGVLPMR